VIPAARRASVARGVRRGCRSSINARRRRCMSLVAVLLLLLLLLLDGWIPRMLMAPRYVTTSLTTSAAGKCMIHGCYCDRIELTALHLPVDD